ncbi:MAG: hypothetical protein EYC69_14870 [Bacteroidetes bacterium]|nr:MAG: hypothetical protein EYC69_14870 [Bacteroidota bacterium]
MKNIVKASLILFCISLALPSQARENLGQQRVAGPGTKGQRIFAGCTPSKARADLDINNVRCPIYINGDMWWDLVGNAEYEVPFGSGKHSLFSGAIWIGGKDASQNLRVAAQTYRQSGSDFWPGPLDSTDASVSNDVCVAYDKHWKITLAEVKEFAEYYATIGNVDNYPVPEVISSWPAMGTQTPGGLMQGRYLAPFFDYNMDGKYSYQDGDYPKFNLSPVAECGEFLLGDQTIWWVFNDQGNIHSETGSQFTIGVEIQAQAFGFNTNDEINNMTFYKYKVINRSSLDLRETYFGSWIDPDLGNYLDDYVGCDVQRGFGYCYNGDADDDGALGYGLNPPAIGVDFFEGPLADANDGKDNNRNGVVDEPGEQIIMSKFVYYDNDFSLIGNPSNATHYYDYLRGVWKDGTKMVYGGNGHLTPGADTCDFMFPGDTDPTGWGTNGVTGLFPWSENQPDASGGAPNQPNDRRFLQSAGAFTLKAGATNFITTGVVWARTSSGGPLASVKLVRLADDKAQILFDNCFKIVDGPDAPELAIRELDKELIFSIINRKSSNNYRELYVEKDPAVTTTVSYYKFEGYQIYQLKDESVAATDLKDPDKARLVFQCDIQNGISSITNQYFQADINAFAPVEEVNGENKGLRHTFRITKDAFATGEPTLVNHKTYYFMAIAYAYNPDENVFDPYVDGLSKPYLAGRRGNSGGAINIFTGIPHISAPEAEGLVLNTSYGDGPEITRITGIGNGYNLGSDRLTLDLKQSQVNEILFNSSQPTNVIQHPTYTRGRGPIDIRIYDPVKVAPGNYELWFTDTITSVKFTGDLVSNSDTIFNVTSIAGLRAGQSLTSTQVDFPADVVIIQIVGSAAPYKVVMSKRVRNTGLIYTAETITSGSRWILKNLLTNRVDTGEKSFEFPYDQLFPDYGFYISTNQVKRPGEDVAGGQGFIEGTIQFDNPDLRWLTGVPDRDDVPFINWIRSGKTEQVDFKYPPTPSNPDGSFVDGSQNFEKIIGGTWAPFRLVSNDATGSASAPADSIVPAHFDNAFGPLGNNAQRFDNLNWYNSVDIVLTADKSKWSRCVVFEMQRTKAKTEGFQGKGFIRKHPSLDKNYQPQSDSGFSWFPGYAVDVESGERLNIAFGEDSYLDPSNGIVGGTGRDMIFNPTSTIFDDNANVIAGGKHVIYVFGRKNMYNVPTPTDTARWSTAYDGCQDIHNKLWGKTTDNQGYFWMERVYSNCMWVGVPLLVPNQSLLATPVKIRLRVTRPYREYTSDSTATFANYRPYYRFNTYDLVSEIKQNDVAKNALSLINIVPNPYYAYSSYETNQLDNRVKIVNLPGKCTITIYSPNGTIIRKLKRDVVSPDRNNSAGSTYPNVNQETSVDWDLKNTVGVPISSGMYIIHVDAPGIGERTIKWFGVLRPLDLDTF